MYLQVLATADETEGSILILGYPYFSAKQCRIGRSNEVFMSKTSSIRPAVSTKHRLMTDKHRAIANIVLYNIECSVARLDSPLQWRIGIGLQCA